jgi:hypothetical protein
MLAYLLVEQLQNLQRVSSAPLNLRQCITIESHQHRSPITFDALSPFNRRFSAEKSQSLGWVYYIIFGRRKISSGFENIPTLLSQ